MIENAKTIHVGIGNSDDKLTQHEWWEFINDVREVIQRTGVRLVGEWFSLPDKQWQNVQFAFQVPNGDAGLIDKIKADLEDLAPLYEQDSIAWCEGLTEFLGARQ